MTGYAIPELGIACLIPGPKERRVTDTSADKWCFGCRKRGAHRLVVLYDAEPSYYDPIAIWECPTCGHDRTQFGCGAY